MLRGCKNQTFGGFGYSYQPLGLLSFSGNEEEKEEEAITIEECYQG
jgi:hypothetical protein